MQVESIPITKLDPAPYNPRIDLKPDDPRYVKLVKSVAEFGLVEPLVWNRRTGHLVAGHQRLKVLVAQGATEAPANVVDLPLEREKALNLALNKISGDWDRDKLAEILQELTASADAIDFDFETTGFDLPETDQLLASLTADDGAEDQFDVEGELARDGPTVTQPGDLIELGLHGQHRLLCGDATSAPDFARLIGDVQAQLLFTDPPYNVAYDGRNRPTAPRVRPNKGWDPIRSDDMSPARYRRWFGQFIDNAAAALTPGAPFYVWNSHRNFGLMHDLLLASGLKVATVITWAKESFCPGFGDYNEQTEHAVYGWKRGARHRFYGPKNASTLWKVNRDRTTAYRHPTQKALELAERAIRNSSKRGQIVLDPFLGSGTTLIGAARLGRRCLGIEIEPRFCDCIVRRYIALAGHGAVSPQLADRYLQGVAT